MESTVSNARHALGEDDGGEAAATRESIFSNARHALGDGDGGEVAAIRESPLFNARHALGDVDGGESAATMESTVSNARHAIVHPLVGHRGGDVDGAGILIFIVATAFVCHFGLLGFRYEIIPNTINLHFFLRTGCECR